MATGNPIESDPPVQLDGDNIRLVARRYLVEETHYAQNERRDSPRYGIVGQGLLVQIACPARLCYHYYPGLVVDVSMYGAGLLCDAVAGERQRIYVRVISSEKSAWMEGRVVSFRPTPRGPHLWGLYFPNCCPHEIFKAVLESHVAEKRGVSAGATPLLKPGSSSEGAALAKTPQSTPRD